MFFNLVHQSSTECVYRGGFVVFLFKSLLLSLSCVSFLHAKETHYDLVLAGGALKTCSSFSIKNCVKKDSVDGGKSQNLYQISPDGFARWSKIAAYSEIPNAEKMNFYAYFEGLKHSQEAVSKADFLDQIDGIVKDNRFTRDLSDAAYFSLLDSFEMVQLDANGKRLVERVSVKDNINTDAQRIYSSFTEQAKLRAQSDNKASILVVTASSRDPYESADFYLGALASEGVTVTWLPLDKAWQQAVYLEKKGFAGCDYLAQLREENLQFYRDRVYPERTQQQVQLCRNPDAVVTLIKQSQGIFFNGGDQSKTLAALLTPDGQVSEVLEAIHQQVALGQLVVGGTSAGTAVQAGGRANQRPIPMLTNGDSAVAMKRGAFAVDAPSQRCASSSPCDTGLNSDDLTMRTAGGTGLFTLGLLDTHFSERDRETRLAVATFDAGQRLGFGVDETTALLIRNTPDGAQAEVVGEGGVFIVDFAQGQSMQDLANKEPMRQLAGEAHYMPDGVSFLVRDNQIIVDPKDAALTSRSKSKAANDGQWRAQVFERCGSRQSIKWQQFDNIYVLKRSEQTQFFKTDRRQCGYTYLPFVISHS